jgi:hypothetical protein
MNAETKIEAGLSGALVKALAEIGGATKDKINPAFKSKYADLGSVVEAIKPILARHGLAFTQATEPSEGGVIVETLLWHEGTSEPRALGKLFVPANKQDAQGFGSALTYARRYGLMTAFGVPAEDDDGNAAARSAPRVDSGKVSPDQFRQLQAKVDATGADLGRFCAYFQVPSLKDVPAARFDQALAALEAKAKKSPVREQLEQSLETVK